MMKITLTLLPFYNITKNNTEKELTIIQIWCIIQYMENS